MAKTKIDEVKEVIENGVKSSLDVYLIELLKALAEDTYTDSTIASADKPRAVADAVFDYLYQNCKGDSTMAPHINNIISKDAMYILRQNIMNALR